MQKHKFPYNWRLSEAKFTKDKGKVFSCFACGGGSTMGYKLAGFDVIGCNKSKRRYKMKIKLNWTYAKGELDTDTLKLICLPARGKRLFGADELDAELCIKDGMNYQIAEIHLGDVESSNILCEEITRRWNEFEDWHECKEDTEDVPPIGTYCILRVEYLCCSNKWKVDYLTAYYNKYGWTEDYLDQITCNYKDYKITHWKPINKPKGVEE